MNLKKTKFSPAWICFSLVLLSLPFAYVAVVCHSYAYPQSRFVIDMSARALLLALPFCLGLSAFGYYKNKKWAQRTARYSAIIFGLIVMCLVILR